MSSEIYIKMKHKNLSYEYFPREFGRHAELLKWSIVWASEAAPETESYWGTWDLSLAQWLKLRTLWLPLYALTVSACYGAEGEPPKELRDLIAEEAKKVYETISEYCPALVPSVDEMEEYSYMGGHLFRYATEIEALFITNWELSITIG